MPRLPLAIALNGLALCSLVQDANRAQGSDRSTLAQSLGFEDQVGGGSPAGWSGGPAGTLFLDDKVVHSGKWAVRLARDAGSPGGFTSLTRSIPADFSGNTLELRGFLRTEGVSSFAGLWVREDGESRAIAFDNMQSQDLKGTTEWKEYSVTLPFNTDARQIFFGALVAGTGKAWVDDLQLLVDGKPIAEAPKHERPKTALDIDHQFDAASGATLSQLSKVQITNLATLGRVWGFLKYHHPKVTSGQVHWDYELFRVLTGVLSAADKGAANAAMARWITGLGEVKPCNPCAKLDEGDLHLPPPVKWIEDETLLDKDLSASLRAIHANRPQVEKQFYVAMAPQVGNPVFEHERDYAQIHLPDAGYQLLGLYRFWNVVQYWFPYRDVIGEDWNGILTEFIPRIALARDKEAYQLELMALIARAQDTHANLWSGLSVRPPTGECGIAVQIRFIEGQPVVIGYAAPEAARDSGLSRGDVITSLDGVPVAKLIEQWRPYYAASNEAARMHDIARSMTRGKCGDVNVGAKRDAQDLKLNARRTTLPQEAAPSTHDRPGETFRLLSKDVAYLKLSSVKISDAAHYVESAAGTKGLIIDIRNYPSQFVVFALGSLLVDRETEFVRFTLPDLSTPGAFRWGPALSLQPGQPHYAGKVVILADEVSLSQAEYTSMAFRSGPKAIVVGSTTAGADGNVSPVPLPGGQSSMISGIGVFYPDKRPTQRVGIIPDVNVRPTIAGIRSGRDEVLEEALRQVLGGGSSAQEIEKMARP